MFNPIELFDSVLQEFHDDMKWDGAILGGIKIISNTKVGSVGQLFIERLCGELSMSCEFPINIKGKRKTCYLHFEFVDLSHQLSDPICVPHFGQIYR